ncbi:hypothetical protein RRG08_016937 [Elysia crispata]|uniref:Uncharacterized protein n=1 Tax=Elysia crispata TaxID=231223 RepID=A0AAE1BDL7_9GAST|nr:hypothetical protein RRG08_016937 [Elysia crispata]
MKKVVIWLDDCGEQNKNWCLFTKLTYLVNSEKAMHDTIELKYFEKGHTYMPADSKHNQLLWYKNEFKEDLCALDFFKSTWQLKEEPARCSPCGISSSKKLEIIKQLVPLMLPTRHAFWKSLPESTAKDLGVEHERRISNQFL